MAVVSDLLKNLDKTEVAIKRLGQMALATNNRNIKLVEELKKANAEIIQLRMERARSREAVHLMINVMPDGFTVPLLYPQVVAQVKKMLKEK